MNFVNFVLNFTTEVISVQIFKLPTHSSALEDKLELIIIHLPTSEKVCRIYATVPSRSTCCLTFHLFIQANSTHTSYAYVHIYSMYATNKEVSKGFYCVGLYFLSVLTNTGNVSQKLLVKLTDEIFPVK